MTKSKEFENFDDTMRQLLKVPHAKLKAALDAEKAAKKRKPRTSASGRASRPGVSKRSFLQSFR